MTVRFYSSTAPEVTLTGGVSNADVIIVVSSTTGFPLNVPYTLAIDYGAPLEELVEVTNAAGTSLTVTRAIDGTSAAAHGAGAKVRHVSSARDFKDSRDHENSNAQHGATGAVVGTTNTQTLTNKTLTNPTINSATMSGTVAGQPDFTDRVDFQNGITTTDDGAGVPLRAIGGAAQTADIFLVENNAGTDLFKVAANGAATFNSTISSGSITATNVTTTNNITAGANLTVNATATMAAATVTGGLTVNGLINANMSAIKLSDTTRTSNALVDDPELSITIPDTNASYAIDGYLIISGDPDNDINVSFTDIAASSGGWTPINFNTGNSGNSGGVEIVESSWSSERSFGLHSSGITRYGIHIKGFIRTLGVSGTLTLRWGTFISGGDGATVNQGSWLRAEQLA